MLKIILLLLATNASALTYTTNLQLAKPARGDTNYVTPFNTGMDVLDAAIIDKRINGAASTVYSTITVATPFYLSKPTDGIHWADGSVSTTAAAGTLAFSGAGTTGTIPKFTGASAVGDSLISESGSDIIVNAYSKLGTTAPAIKMIVLSTMTGLTEGALTYVDVTGVEQSSIPFVSVMVDGVHSATPAIFDGYEFTWYVMDNSGTARIYIKTSDTNSENILNTPASLLVIYVE